MVREMTNPVPSPLGLRTRVAFVLHARQARRYETTSSMLQPVLSDSSLHLYGRRDHELDLTHLHEHGRRVLVLFPSEHASELCPEFLLRDPRPITLVVPDGTWRQARRATLRIPGLANAERVRVNENELSTLDALTRALVILEGPPIAQELGERWQEVALDSRRPSTEKPPRPNRVPDAAEHDIAAESPLEILYRDEHLLAIQKPSGMLVHRGWARDERPALQRLRDQIGMRVHAVHRLDRATSGALLFALRPEAARDTQRLFESGRVEKRYLAICRGNSLPSGHVDHPLRREKGGEMLSAITRFRLLGRFERYCLIEAFPETGRTHQIRRHLKHLSLPIIGDVRYGKGEHNRHFRERFDFHRLALHCQRLTFPHPRTGQLVEITAPLPSDFHALAARFQ